jgi:aminodeoxyfutalosine synthase
MTRELTVVDVVERISERVLAGERLTDAEALELFERGSLVELGRLADQVNRSKNQDRVFYNVNRHINPTNICALSCKFCSYSRKPGEPGGYAWSIDEMVGKAGEALAQGATEVHMVGGLHPRWKFDYYKDMIAAVKKAHPALHIKAFTAVELDWLARKARKTILQVLEELKESGLGSLPGGGAEIFHPEIRDVICDTKLTAEQWLDTHRLAHGLGMKSNATMLYGHIETYAHRVDHMRRLRELQDETGGFNAFIPLAFQPFGNDMGIDHYTYGFDDLKTLAIARLYLDNFKHLKAYWIMLGQDIAQLAVTYGANDLDGTVIDEKISNMAGGRSGIGMTKTRIEQVIRKAGRVAVERDTLYNAVAPAAAPSPAAERPEAKQKAPEAKGDLLAVIARLTAADAEPIEEAELIRLASDASLHHLAELAEAQTAHDPDSGSFSPSLTVVPSAQRPIGEIVREVEEAAAEARRRHLLGPMTVVLDLAAAEAAGVAQGADGDAGLDPGMLVELAWALQHQVPGIDLAIQGLKSVWRMAQEASVPVRDLLVELNKAGIHVVESSLSETESDLTPSEVVDLHREVHAAELSSVGKLELSAPRSGGAEPHWPDFVRRALALGQLPGGRGGLLGISVLASPGSFVTAAEYLRAIAIARLACPDVPMIIAPYDNIPTLAPGATSTEASAVPQHPAEKIAPLTLLYGAADLGHLDLRRFNPVVVMRQIRAAGLSPKLRDASLANSEPDAPLASRISSIRHSPVLAATL